MKRILAFAATCLAGASLFALDVKLMPDGSLRLEGEDSIGPLCYLPGWGGCQVKSPMELAKDGVARFKIYPWGSTDAPLFTGETRCEPSGDGRLRATWTLVCARDCELQTLAVSAHFVPSDAFDRAWSSDGKSHGTLPRKYAGKTSLGGGSVSRLAIPCANGKTVKFEFARPVGFSAQDSRAWGNGWGLRFGNNASRKYAKGEKFEVSLTLGADDRIVFSRNELHVIREGERWVRLDYRKDIVAGSALDFSNQGFLDAPAGKYGWTKVVGDHFEFERKPGVAQRFYGVNLCFDACYPTHEETDALVTRLARLGYNAIRIHHYDRDATLDRSDGTTLNETRVERLDYLIAKAIEKGLYITTDLFVSRQVPWRSVGVDKPGTIPVSLYKTFVMCHEPSFRNWCDFSRNFLLHKNRYTGRTYLDEPALSLVSLVNEGGVFMGWNAEKRNDPRLLAAWGEWIAENRARDPKFYPEADPACVPASCWGDGANRAFALFQGYLERNYVRKMKSFLRSLGSKALFTNDNCGPHWAALQEASVEYDYIDDHFYVDHPEFIDRPWNLPSRCPNANPVQNESLPPCVCAFVRMNDKPFTVTEWNFSGPGMYRGVGGIMTGAMAALQDWDGLWRFAYSHSNANFHDRPNGCPSYFDVATDPLSQASDRASICLFLRGDARPLDPKDGVSLLITPESVDPAKGNCSKAFPGSPRWKDVSWRRRVSSCLSASAAPGQQIVPRHLAEDEAETARQLAHRAPDGAQISFDRVRGSMTLDTPRTCGGFAPFGRLVAGAIDFTVAGAPATVWASSLDAKPVARSRRILLSHLTDVQGDGIRYLDDTRRVTLAWGKGPLVENGSAEIRLALERPERYSVYELATTGARVGKVPTAIVSGKLAFTATVRGPHGKARMLYEIAADRSDAVWRAPGGGDPAIRGPFPILSTPFEEDGAVDYESLARGMRFTADGGCPGVIWCQSNDAVDLLSFEEKARGYEVCATALEGRDDCVCCLGCNGTVEQMLREAREIEKVAARHPRTKVAMISRPPDDGKTLDDVRRYYEALAAVARRPVIIQTVVNDKCPSPTPEMLIDLARRFPHCYGYIKEESGGAKANDNMIKENAAKPVIHTVMSAWGGWQWLYQSRRCGSEGLVTERCAYAPLLGYIWRQMEDDDPKGTLTAAYALLRLLIDQRNMPGGLRGYSLYYLQREGVFKTTVSREYLKSEKKEQGTVATGPDRKKWKLGKLELTEMQKAELDRCYDDAMRFVREN